MAKITSTKALESGTKLASARSAKIVALLTFAGGLSILAQLSLAGKKKRYLLTFALTVVGLILGIMFLVQSSMLNDVMLTSAKITCNTAGTEVKIDGEPLKADDIDFETNNVDLLVIWSSNDRYLGTVARWVLADGSNRFFTESGEISLEDLEARYPNRQVVKQSSYSVEITPESTGEATHTWTYSVSNEKRVFSYKAVKGMTCVSVDAIVTEKLADYIYKEETTIFDSNPKFAQAYSATLYFNETTGQYETKDGDRFVHSEKWSQKRTQGFAALIAAGAGLVLMYVFLFMQMGETKSYRKYMQKCASQLPREERKAFRNRADLCLQNGNMEDARALLEEHGML